MCTSPICRWRTCSSASCSAGSSKAARRYRLARTHTLSRYAGLSASCTAGRRSPADRFLPRRHQAAHGRCATAATHHLPLGAPSAEQGLRQSGMTRPHRLSAFLLFPFFFFLLYSFCKTTSWVGQNAGVAAAGGVKKWLFTTAL